MYFKEIAARIIFRIRIEYFVFVIHTNKQTIKYQRTESDIGLDKWYPVQSFESNELKAQVNVLTSNILEAFFQIILHPFHISNHH